MKDDGWYGFPPPEPGDEAARAVHFLSVLYTSAGRGIDPGAKGAGSVIVDRDAASAAARPGGSVDGTDHEMFREFAVHVLCGVEVASHARIPGLEAVAGLAFTMERLVVRFIGGACLGGPVTLMVSPRRFEGSPVTMCRRNLSPSLVWSSSHSMVTHPAVG